LIYNPKREHKKRPDASSPLPTPILSPLHSSKEEERIVKKEDRASRSPTHKTRFPDNFSISDSLRVWCVSEHGISEPEAELEAFRDFHVSKGNTFVDWERAFMTWIRNTHKFGRNGKKAEESVEGGLSERTKRILRRGL
jgi:hypothetical protein